MRIAACIAVCGFAVAANAQIAGTDFDGNDVNLITSTVPALDGGPGDWFGVGSIGAWPGSGGVPFGIADDSVAAVSGGTPFAGDTEGIFGQNRDVNDAFFGLSDSDEFGTAQTASWTFDVSGFTDLSMSVDFGGISNSSFDGYSTGSFITFEVLLDGVSLGDAISFTVIDNNGYVARNMDSGNVGGGGRLLQGAGDFGLTKFSADTGLAVADTISDKSTVAGGVLDTFTSGVFSTAGGSQLEIRLTADLPFEAAAFDNLAVNGIPTPGAAALAGLAGLAAVRRRR